MRVLYTVRFRSDVFRLRDDFKGLSNAPRQTVFIAVTYLVFILRVVQKFYERIEHNKEL